ncbi:STAS domain-containing protein [Streptomyces sp. IBSNAI002]|uniref:STAS domain-containing protein n=1 Tax=Streptomyces sp. IBSNAI002 TaxID=3457500 RepID=UPI003FD4AF11
MRIAVRGYVGPADAAGLRSVLCAAAAEWPLTVVDLSETTSCDRAALNALFAAYLEARLHGRRLQVRAVPEACAGTCPPNRSRAASTPPKRPDGGGRPLRPLRHRAVPGPCLPYGRPP